MAIIHCRAKVFEATVARTKGKPVSECVRLTGLGPDGQPLSPNVEFKLFIGNPDAIGRFEIGKEYFVDFTPIG